jgi:hypothetical protein
MCRCYLCASIPQLLPPTPHANRTTSAGTLITAALCPVLFEVPRNAGFDFVDLP